MAQEKSGRAWGKPRTRRANSAETVAVSQQTPRQGPPSFPVSLHALARLRRQDLLILAQREGLRGRSRLSKKDLAQALKTLLKRRTRQTEGPPLPSFPDRENAPLPETYGKDRLVLMPIDPYWVHAYWEFSSQSAPQSLRGTEMETGEARSILRVYDVTFIEFDGTNAHSSFDIAIKLQARNWYINLGSPDKTLCAELGLLRPDGTFFPQVRSNIIHIPPAWASPIMEERWVQAGGEDLTRGHEIPSHGRVDPSPRVGPPPPTSPPSGPALEESSPERFRPGAQERSPGPEIDSAETLLHPQEAIQAEEYRHFLESSRRRRIVGRDEPALPMLWPSSLEQSGGVPEIGLSSSELVKIWIGRQSVSAGQLPRRGKGSISGPDEASATKDMQSLRREGSGKGKE